MQGVAMGACEGQGADAGLSQGGMPADTRHRHPLPCRGLHGRKLETGYTARQDLLLFGEAADPQGGEGASGEDQWIGLDTSAAEGAQQAGGGSGGGRVAP